MEERPGRIVDYALVVGLGENVSRFKVEAYGEGGEESLHLTTPKDVPITDIAIIAKKYETCPKGFKCIEVTSGGNNASLVSPGLFGTPLLLCYRVGGDDRPAVTEISIYNAEHSKSIPSGHEAIFVTVGGRSADLSGGGRYPIYLTVKKGLTHGYNMSTAISSIAVVTGREGIPSGFKVLSLLQSKGFLSSGIRICYKSSLIATQSLSYTAEILSRYPTADYPQFPLPESVPLFCLPFGVSVEAWERHASFPLPAFSTFALTSATGQCMYGACIVFYEKIPRSFTFLSSMKKTLGVEENEALHVSKCICLLSHWPFFSAFKSFLSALYRLSISKNIQLPLERYVANLMFHVPFPSVERPRVLLLIGPETIVFSLPVQTPLPMGISAHWTLLSCLDADDCILLIHLILLEQKIVLHSSKPALLTTIGEALRSVLFPLQWKCTYIPMCPLAFCSYLQAPVPFIIGMDSRYFDCYTAPPGVCVVDLDTNTILIPSDIRALLNSSPLPQKPVKVLKKTLTPLATEVASYRFDGDFAVEVAPLEVGDLLKINQERADVIIREAFLKFMAMILVNYRLYLRPLTAQRSRSLQDVSELFDLTNFIKNKSSSERNFYSTFFDTQIFTSFIEQRSFAHAESTALAFFDECTEKVLSDVNQKLLNIDKIVSRRYDLPTVVTPPPDETGLPLGKKFTYDVFPPLDPTLFLSPVSPTNSPYDKSTSVSHTVSESAFTSVALRTQAEKTKNKNLIQRASGSDVLWAKVLLSHACSSWYMLLSYHLRSQWNKVEVLSQALELLDALRVRDALPNDEVCYRILMKECIEMGRPALAVKVYSEIQKAGIHPSAVTYGFYNKALMEGSWPSVKRHWNVLRIVIFACFYLRKLQQKSINGDKKSKITVEETRANFRLLSHSSSVDVSALDVDQSFLERRDSASRLNRGSVYRLSSRTASHGQSDYAIRGDSFYIADKSPLLTSCVEPIQRIGRTTSSINVTPRKVPASMSGDDGRVEICISSCSQCSGCKSLLYDEEIMVCWTEKSAEEYNINCPYCNKPLVPNLTVMIRKVLPVNRTKRIDSKRSTPDRVIEEELHVSQENESTCSSIQQEPILPSKSEPIHRKSLSLGRFEAFPDQNGHEGECGTSDLPSTETTEVQLDRDDTDSPSTTSIGHYISLLRERGHRRTSSAPIAPIVQPAVPAVKSAGDQTLGASPVTLRPKNCASKRIRIFNNTRKGLHFKF
ncbi:PREDICTED: C-myc promoter-binding protein-like isoform X2 [Amphimedon queenslandica]|uniref:UDENN domain-containing protein n=1 Tax=Amphimedon queenslandica TaxID=400682 RepID=A0AAN0JI34_AMPQE|nr:PREDICTED: C-myc promoter-binding protein-like isoform X2 [Amphimedon queenslandica]|eukprot:XP_019856639.1 PREDICTED: C-myc promoter-binding protein-like isoform X2 [Amphimedon queenslandica]